jgi:hypothetical protein
LKGNDNTFNHSLSHPMNPTVKELADQMAAKTTEDLLAMFAREDDWSAEALGAAAAELQRRKTSGSKMLAPVALEHLPLIEDVVAMAEQQRAMNRCLILAVLTLLALLLFRLVNVSNGANVLVAWLLILPLTLFVLGCYISYDLAKEVLQGYDSYVHTVAMVAPFFNLLYLNRLNAEVSAKLKARGLPAGALGVPKQYLARLPSIDLVGWVEVKLVEPGGAGTADRDAGPTPSFLLRSDAKAAYVLLFSKGTKFSLSNAALYLTPDAKYNVKGHVFDAQTMCPELGNSASQAILVTSISTVHAQA